MHQAGIAHDIITDEHLHREGVAALEDLEPRADPSIRRERADLDSFEELAASTPFPFAPPTDSAALAGPLSRTRGRSGR